jgi:hypothetical protein
LGPKIEAVTLLTPKFILDTLRSSDGVAPEMSDAEVALV